VAALNSGGGVAVPDKAIAAFAHGLGAALKKLKPNQIQFIAALFLLFLLTLPVVMFGKFGDQTATVRACMLVIFVGVLLWGNIANRE
jgi:hypothetical protein